MAKKKKKEDESLFVGITNGEELRRGILECSRGILEAMKEYENFKSVRQKKAELINVFRNNIKEVSRLMNSIRGNLPQIKEVEIAKPEIKVESKPKMVKVEKPTEKTEIERLEDELNEIEQKLNGLV